MNLTTMGGIDKAKPNHFGYIKTKLYKEFLTSAPALHFK